MIGPKTYKFLSKIESVGKSYEEYGFNDFFRVAYEKKFISSDYDKNRSKRYYYIAPDGDDALAEYRRFHKQFFITSLCAILSLFVSVLTLILSFFFS